MKKHSNLTILGLLRKKVCKSKEPIDLLSVNVDQIVVSDKFKHNNEDFKYFIGYLEGRIVKWFCIILPQMSGYIKYFENVAKRMCIINMQKFLLVVKTLIKSFWKYFFFRFSFWTNQLATMKTWSSSHTNQQT